jgi:hypothetical protein
MCISSIICKKFKQFLRLHLPHMFVTNYWQFSGVQIIQLELNISCILQLCVLRCELYCWWLGKAETFVGALDYICGSTVYKLVFFICDLTPTFVWTERPDSWRGIQGTVMERYSYSWKEVWRRSDIHGTFPRLTVQEQADNTYRKVETQARHIRPLGMFMLQLAHATWHLMQVATCKTDASHAALIPCHFLHCEACMLVHTNHGFRRTSSCCVPRTTIQHLKLTARRTQAMY